MTDANGPPAYIMSVSCAVVDSVGEHTVNTVFVIITKSTTQAVSIGKP